MIYKAVMKPDLNRLPWDFLVLVFLGSALSGWILLSWMQLNLHWKLAVTVFLYTFIVLLVFQAIIAMGGAGFSSIQIVWVLVVFAATSFALGGLTSIFFHSEM